MNRKYNAFATLITVIVISVVSTLIIVSSVTANTETFINQTSLENANISKYLSLSCGEIALNSLKASLTYIGSETKVLSQGSCNIEAVTGSGNTGRTITVNATYKTYTKRYLITINTVNPTMDITSWVEIN